MKPIHSIHFCRILALFLILCALLSACSGTVGVRTRTSGEETQSASPSPASEPESLPSQSGNPSSPGGVPAPDDPYEDDPALRVTELMVNNRFSVKDENGKYLPWVELQNVSSGALSLSGYALTVDGKTVAMPDKTVGSGEYFLLFVEGMPSSGEVVLRHGEAISQRFVYLNEHPNCSFLTENGSETPTPTPGYGGARDADAIVFSEVTPLNFVYPVDGMTGAYIELYNAGTGALPLGSFWLSDRSEDRYLIRLPEMTLAPGAYAVLPCAGELHFSLSSFGGTLYLTRDDGVLSASITYPEAQKNRAFTGSSWQIPSPGYPNTEKGRMDYAAARTGLLLNEILPSNTKYSEKNGKYYDLLELKNASDTALDLSGYFLSDKQKDLKKYRLPAVTLQPGEYYLLYCSGYEGIECPLKLSSLGELLVLSDENGRISDALEYPAIPVNRSWGRSEGQLVYFKTPTPGKTNGSGLTELTKDPAASVPSGFYTEAFDVTLSGQGTLFYTLDGSRPTGLSKKYAGETIRVEKDVTLRVFAVDGDKIESAVKTYNYFLNAIDLTLPVAKLSVANDDMYGAGGIYTNYTKDLEVEGHLAFYVDGQEEFSVNCGVKIHGNYSRKYAKKSYQLKFRAIYGDSKLRYDLFGDGKVTEFNSIVLRSGSQDHEVTMMRDEVVTGMVLRYARGILAQNYRPMNLYINGEYVGVYYFREKISQDFVASYWNVNPDTVTIIQSLDYVEKGPAGDWYTLRKFIYEKDLTVPENYEYICKRFDIDGLIDYYILYTWADNRDNGNTRLCRSDEYDDGRWHFIFYDSDMAFGIYLQNNPSTADYLFAKLQQNSGFHNSLIYKLFRNETFRDLFLRRLADLTENALTNENVLGQIESIRGAIDHDMQYSKYGVKYNSWVVLVQRMKDFVTDRGEKIRREFADLFGLSEAQRKKYFG